MFYLQDYLICKKGEKLRGTFKMTPNTRNVRDMDFDISIKFEVQSPNLLNLSCVSNPKKKLISIERRLKS